MHNAIVKEMTLYFPISQFPHGISSSGSKKRGRKRRHCLGHKINISE